MTSNGIKSRKEHERRVDKILSEEILERCQGRRSEEEKISNFKLREIERETKHLFTCTMVSFHISLQFSFCNKELICLAYCKTS